MKITQCTATTTLIASSLAALSIAIRFLTRHSQELEFSHPRAAWLRCLQSLSGLSMLTILVFACLSTVAQGEIVFEDDFERPDGPIDGWTVDSGNWTIVGAGLRAASASAQQDIFAGNPVERFTFGLQASIEFYWEFLAPGSNPSIGRVAGVNFAFNQAGNRFAASTNGYQLYWIDHVADWGLNLLRFDGVVSVPLGRYGDLAEPPRIIRIEIEGDTIRVYGDDELYIEVVDATYREGVVGFWTPGGDQLVAFDDVVVERRNPSVPVCKIDAPAVVSPNQNVTFDGSGSSDGDGSIVRYDWDFGDGSGASGVTVPHTYAFDGFYTVTLVVEDESGNIDACSIVVEVSTPTDCHDDFERAPGPLDGWTVVDGFWNIVGNECETISTAIEHAAFLGVPPKALPLASYDICFDWRFLTPGSHPEVGRHAGVLFEFNKARNRKDPTTGGYQVDWIDRASDRGLRLTRWEDSGAEVNLVEGQGVHSPVEPPASIRIEVRGDNIKVFGDDVLYIDFDDGTYRRRGRVGLWTYQADQHVAFDNFKVLVGPPLDPICDFVGPPQLEFADDFNRNASQVDGWTVDAGDWSIDNGRLQIGPTNAEQDIFAGDPPLILASTYIIEFDIEFLGPGSNAEVGRHAGVNFGFNQVGNRDSAATNGYQVYWIDRAADRGFSLRRFDGVVNVPLAVGQAGNLIDPPRNIRVEVDACNIRVYGDDVLYIDVMDATYRGGFAGLWTWEGDQEVTFDNFAIDPPSEEGSYEAWAQQFIPAGKDRSFGGDGDDDGDPNGYEFGVDAQGGVSDSESNRKAILKPSPNSSAVDIEFGYRPGNTDLIWIVERGDDLVQFEEIYRLEDGVQWLPTNILARLDPTDSSRLIVTDSNPLDPRCFYQLRIERRIAP